MKYEAVEVGIPWDKRKGMATWSKGMAEKAVRKLRPLVGKRVLLYGGGGTDENIATLKSVKMGKPFYYLVEGRQPPVGATIMRDPHPIPKGTPARERSLGYYSPTDYYVNAELHLAKGQQIGGRPTFSPHLGSWRLAKLRKVV
jgi:hypothetical protein